MENSRYPTDKSSLSAPLADLDSRVIYNRIRQLYVKSNDLYLFQSRRSQSKEKIMTPMQSKVSFSDQFSDQFLLVLVARLVLVTGFN